MCLNLDAVSLLRALAAAAMIGGMCQTLPGLEGVAGNATEVTQWLGRRCDFADLPPNACTPNFRLG